MQRPTIYIATDPGGLWRPPALRGLPTPQNPGPPLPPELLPEPIFRIVRRANEDDIPEGQDFVYCAPTPQDLDLPEPQLEDAVELLNELPFIQTMRMLSLLAGAVYH